MRPTPSRPEARKPSAGPTVTAPRAASRSTFARTAAWAHMADSIAGASNTGPWCARKYVDRKSSASPLASLPSVCAVAGATSRRSHPCASSTWSTAAALPSQTSV
jgi:hypothetical protein